MQISPKSFVLFQIITIMVIVMMALGHVSEEYDRWMGKLGITCNVGVIEKTTLLGTARILRKVLEM